METSEVTIDVGEDEHIWDAALKAGYDLPASCLQGWCVTCAGKLQSGTVDQSDSVRYFPEDRSAGYVLLCTAKPRSPLRIVTHQKAECQAHRAALGLPVPKG